MNVTWADSSTNPATPISLSGYRAHMQIRAKAGSFGPPLLDLSSTGTSPALTIEPNAQTGVVAIRIGATDTALLTKTCAYDLFVIKTTDPTEATRLIYGAVTVERAVTVNTP